MVFVLPCLRRLWTELPFTLHEHRTTLHHGRAASPPGNAARTATHTPAPVHHHHLHRRVRCVRECTVPTPGCVPTQRPIPPIPRDSVMCSTMSVECLCALMYCTVFSLACFTFHVQEQVRRVVCFLVLSYGIHFISRLKTRLILCPSKNNCALV